jgi:hypothetical protein
MREMLLNRTRWIALGFVLFTVPSRSWAIGIDLLGDVTKPLIGEAKDKAQGILRFAWAMPYGGYTFGQGGYTLFASTSNVTQTGNFNMEGFVYGVRGGLELARTFRLGVDYSMHVSRIDEKLTSSAGASTSRNLGAKGSMLGFCLGFDIPRTPLQGFGAKYVRANLQTDSQLSGTGWGAGVNFMIANPFILLVEHRQIEMSSDVSATGAKSTRNTKLYFVALSFLLL